MKTADIIGLGIAAFVLAVSLAGFIHARGAFKAISSEDTAAQKKAKRRKKLFFVGMIFSAWLIIGILLTAFSGIKSGLKLEFSMFSERVELFGVSLAKTTVTSTCVTVVLIILCVLFRIFAVPKFKERPAGLQNAMEICVEAMDSFTKKAVGEEASAVLSPYMFAMAAFLIGCALTELLGLRAPTSDLTVTFAMGLLTFALLNIFGIKRLGFFGRLKAMGGPIAPMRAVMIPLKMVSDIAVPVSLACRLFGNMLGGMIVMELLKGALGAYSSGIPAIAGLYFNVFHPLIQAYIFITLSLTFIDEAMEPTEGQRVKQKIKKQKSADITA